MKIAPNNTVSAKPQINCERLLAIRAWCAHVKVRPEVSSNAVLMVGIGHGPMVWNASTVPAGPVLGQLAVKSGHRNALLSISPSQGIAI